MKNTLSRDLKFRLKTTRDGSNPALWCVTAAEGWSPSRIFDKIFLSWTGHQSRFVVQVNGSKIPSRLGLRLKWLCGSVVCGSSAYPAAPKNTTVPLTACCRVLCTDSCSDGQVPVPLGQTERWESRCVNGWWRVQRRSNRGGWEEWRRIPVPLRGVHWTGQHHLPHLSGHGQNPTR